MKVAVNPGQVASSIAESADVNDLVDGRMTLWDAARRGGAEELGAPEDAFPDTAIELLAVLLDTSSVRGYQFVGVVHSADPIGTWERAHLDAPDGFEAADSVVVELTVAGVTAFLADHLPGRVTGPTVPVLLRALDRVVDGGSAAVHAELGGRMLAGV